jgi:hypothetical protein
VRGFGGVVSGVCGDQGGDLVKFWTKLVRNERGDVPGWVLVTVMSAGLVTMLWFLADGLLADVFTRAVDSVTGP